MFGLRKTEKVKQAHSIVQVIESYGVKLKPCGSGKYMGLCPFHDDHNPSLLVDEERGQFKCFAGCGSGSVIDWEMLQHGIGFKDAVSKLGEAELPNGSIRHRPMEKETAGIPDLKVLQDAVGYYHRCLMTNREAQDYLKKRGIFSPDLVERFRIGYADGSLKKLLHGDGIEAAQSIGILSDLDSEVFAGYLVFPVEDQTGAVINLYGRLVGGSGHLPNHRYLKGPNRSVFNWKAIKAHKEIVLVESIIDCLSMHVMGVANCVPLYGTQGLTKDHLDLFRKYETEEVILMMDSDEAGSKAAESILRRLDPLGMKVSKITLPAETNDPNDLLQKRSSQKPVEQLLDAREYLRSGEKERPAGAAAGHHGNGNGHLTIDHDGIRFTAKGLRAVTDTSMKVLLEARSNGHAHTDRFDLYVSRSRKTFANALAKTFNLQQAKIDEALLALVKAVEKKRREEKEAEDAGEKPYVMTDNERKSALHFLQFPDLLNRINDIIRKMGYVGEDTNRKLAYLVAISSKIDSPLSLLIRSNSSAGKSELMEKVVALMPDEDVFFLSRISPQALYYMGDNALVHKLVIVDEKRGAEEAEYSIRNLQSRKKLSMAVVMKDPQTGKSRTVIFEVAGPIAYMDGSTSTRDNPENENRCFVVFLDESREQTERVIESQKLSRSLKGKRTFRKLDERILTARNAVRLLDPVKVTIPFLDRITFPSEHLRARRDHSRFLNLIESIAFLHQHQRDRKTDPVLGTYIEATPDDYQTAYELVRSTVGTTYHDIPRFARIVLEGIRDRVGKAAAEEKVEPVKYEFTRRKVRGWLRISDDQAKRALRSLVDLEYLTAKAQGRGGRLVYRLGEIEMEQAIVEKLTPPEDLT